MENSNIWRSTAYTDICTGKWKNWYKFFLWFYHFSIHLDITNAMDLPNLENHENSVDMIHVFAPFRMGKCRSLYRCSTSQVDIHVRVESTIILPHTRSDTVSQYTQLNIDLEYCKKVFQSQLNDLSCKYYLSKARKKW
jgi:hypothetical protein